MDEFTYERLPNETVDEYEYRICSMKDAIGSWDDVARIINDELEQDYTESRYRKKYAQSQEYLSLGSGYIVDIDALDDESKESLNYAMERQKVHAQKLEMSRQIRQQGRFEFFYQNVKDAIATLPVPEFEPLPSSSGKKEYVLAVADLHYGSSYTSENNIYSREIAKQRLEDLCWQTIEFIKENGLSHLNIVSLGDTIEGILRMTDLKLNDIPVVDAVVEVSRLMAQFLNSLSVHCEIDFYAVSAANHSQTRPLGSKASELATEDLERIIVNYISDMLEANNRVIVHTDLSKDYIAFKIFDFDCIALHGHQVGNLNNAIKDYSALHQKFYSYMMIGHLHSPQEIVVGERDHHNCEVLVSGAMIGSCQYSDKILKGAKACAKIYTFDEKHGHIGSTTFILN